MPLKTLEYLAGKVAYDALPASWTAFDLGRFAPGKTLWDYQQDGLRKALCVLFKYYDEFEDFTVDEHANADQDRKRKLAEWYRDGMLLSDKDRTALNLDLKRAKAPLRALIAGFLPLSEEDSILRFQDICSRMGFWMATGSGKTIVLVKLLELLHLLMRRREIPGCEVLMLTCRDDLLDQFTRTVAEYNAAPDAPVHLELRELRDYPEAKREAPGGLLGAESTLRVFYYRSDNLSDEHKERIVDFRNYDNDGRWYVLLDEAHKGGAEDSKRKHLFTILTRAGFLFNFSATFTDRLDLATTVHNFNLSEFIGWGYGKHIAVLRQELTAFRKGRSAGDYTDDEKRKVVVKSMILLAYTASKVRQIRDEAARPTLYHQPLLMALVHSVNTADADLKLYFQQILAIGRGDVPAKVWQEAKVELWEELREEPRLLFEPDRGVQIAKEDIDTIESADVWREVYNVEAQHGGGVEVLVRPGNRQEIAFKMKASDRPFALIKIGDIAGWLREQLTGFDYIETLENESFFNGLSDPGSSINILMGSRSFYEGWDSNRPNVINFVNIGMGEDAKKFILQAVGRGVRIETWDGARRRLEELFDGFDDKDLFRRLRTLSMAPETLYVLGTNRQALQIVLETLHAEKPAKQRLLKLERNPDAEDRLLLVPEYRDHGVPLIDERAPAKFEIAAEDFTVLANYARAVADDRVLLLAHGTQPKKVEHFRRSLSDSDTYYAKQGGRPYRNLEVMVGKVLDYFALRTREVDRLRALDDRDIVHFRHIAVDQEHVEEIQRRVDRVLFSQSAEGKAQREAIQEKVRQGEFDFEEAVRQITDEGLTGRQRYRDELSLEYLANHYYLPVLYSTHDRLDYIRHIIDIDSEVQFLEKLRDYAKKPDAVLRTFDWWMFSKLNQHLDKPFIPYYSPRQNRIAAFYPDFVFWGQRGESYTILFVDPKGMENQDWERKAEGYMRVFEQDGIPRVFEVENMQVQVRLCYFTKDRNVAADGSFKRFWADNLEALFKSGFGIA